MSSFRLHIFFFAVLLISGSVLQTTKSINYMEHYRQAWTEDRQLIPKGPIPHSIWFTYHHDILEAKAPLNFYNNIVKSIDAYRILWNNDTEMKVNFLVDDNCTDLLDQIDQELNLTLGKAFRNENQGQFKADLCRLAALYLNGGYYFDIDMEVIQPILLNDDISFSSAMATLFPVFFQSYLASTARHPILRSNLDTMEEFYRGEGECKAQNTGIIGCCTLMTAWNQTDNRGQVKLLEEIYLNHEIFNGTYRNVPFRGGNPECHWIVHDPEDLQAYFYSRMHPSPRCI
jgi:mannosyltransferase OCH1-like enzyme